MVRTYKKKRENTVNEDDIKEAVLQVINGNMKLRTAASVYGLNSSTLFYRVQKSKKNKPLRSENFSSKYTVAQVFTNDEEKMLEQYLLKMSKMNYGLTYLGARSLAFEYATALKKCPDKWTENKQAGIEWMKGFMKRHKKLSLRKPENTSLTRSTSFNKHNVEMFYNNYERALQKTNFTPDRIFNLDETNIMTVVQAPNVIAETGLKQVGQNVSGERGQLITMCGIVNAIGNTIPPVFIFPRAKFHDSMINGAPPGSVGYANSPRSGWMTGSLFLKVLEHIQRITRCNKDDKILLLLDNHESHCTLNAINYCRENGIVLLTFPPHCTHQMQPLDVAVNGPFKQKIAVAQNDWLLNHPASTITIHNLVAIVTPAYNASYTPNNILSGFADPGIYPFNRYAFTEDDFQCAEVTNRPPPEQPTENEEPVAANASLQGIQMLQPTATLQEMSQMPQTLSSRPEQREQECFSPSILDQHGHEVEQTPPEIPGLITPEMVKPFPKAPPRKNCAKGRKRGRSRILTDTPEKNEIESAYLERQKRLEKSKIGKPRTKANLPTKSKALTKGKSKSKKKSTFTSSSESENEEHIFMDDDTDMDATDASDYFNEDEEMRDPAPSIFFSSENINVGDFVLVECSSETQKTSLVFVARVDEKDLNTFIVSYLKRKGYLFFFPEKEDKWPITVLDIVTKLPTQNHAPGTSRTAAKLSFDFDFELFKLG